ncbi:hypothetical protein DLAC_07866 [Tieghemostelium lacteum]|uniref:Guanylate kinase-like domain-containing protein n=1 Tax=Tieghemostelium lacteum TaxID=361077 RepID=A0A151ZAM2_TIELA|nr:hypothetical protein DLAC_07866 [Tieghemostelium lacteum]|eukprot:KYQ90978.1 hypothetical protein DLAC_07866 [Tieghemostelium lacteum]
MNLVPIFITGLIGLCQDYLMERLKLDFQDKFIDVKFHSTKIQKELLGKNSEDYFISKDILEREIREKNFIVFYERLNIYLSRLELQRIKDMGKLSLIFIDIPSSKTIKQEGTCKNAIFICITSKSIEQFRDYQKKKNLDNEIFEYLIDLAKEDIPFCTSDHFDNIIYQSNDNLEECYQQLTEILIPYISIENTKKN